MNAMHNPPVKNYIANIESWRDENKNEFLKKIITPPDAEKNKFLKDADLNYEWAAFTDTLNLGLSQNKLPEVTKIYWSKFNKPVPNDSVFQAVKFILLNVNKFALNTWFLKIRKYKKDSSGYLDLKSISTNNENRYRLPAGMAFGLAISLKTGAYNPSVTGASSDLALDRTIQLLTAVAYDHKANNTRKVWGGEWQAASWAYYAGYAGWLLWDKLKLIDRENIQRMIISEANRLLKIPAPFYKDKVGKSIFPGDSKIEENDWNAELLYLAAVMMPSHPNSKLWFRQSLSYMISGVSLPSDLHNQQILHGKKVKDWLNGYNVEEPGIVINHGIIHPLYNALSSVVNAPIVFSLVGLPTPEAARFNMNKIYSSLINTEFDSSKYEKPGGTMYIKGESEVYYPQGSDWGTEIYDSFANIDIAAWMYQFDKGQKYNGKYWAALHLKAIVNQQKRFNDGHTYLNNKEDSYFGKEAAISTRMASAWMTIFLQCQSPAIYKNYKVEQ